jgi:hypothetical protein
MAMVSGVAAKADLSVCRKSAEFEIARVPIAMITSPTRSPACAAGDPATTVETRIP